MGKTDHFNLGQRVGVQSCFVNLVSNVDDLDRKIFARLVGTTDSRSVFAQLLAERIVTAENFMYASIAHEAGFFRFSAHSELGLMVVDVQR